MLLAAEVMETIKAASTYDDLKAYASSLGDKLGLTQEVMGFLGQFAMKGDYERYIADASIFMEFFSRVVMAWMWLDMVVQAKKALLTGDKTYREEFYNSKIHAMKFYFKYELSKTSSFAEILMSEEVLTIPTEEEVFA